MFRLFIFETFCITIDGYLTEKWKILVKAASSALGLSHQVVEKYIVKILIHYSSLKVLS